MKLKKFSTTALDNADKADSVLILPALYFQEVSSEPYGYVQAGALCDLEVAEGHQMSYFCH